MDQSKKTMRHFYCRDVLWETFEQMANDFDCSIDYLVNEAMRYYARSKNYQSPGGGGGPNLTGPQPVAGGNNNSYGSGAQPAPKPGAPRQQPVTQPPPQPSMGAGGRTRPAPPTPGYAVQRGNGPAAAMMQQPQQQQHAAPAMSQGPAPQPASGGYPSNGAMPAAGAGPTLFLVYNGQRYPVTKDQFIIGRGSKTSDLPIKDGNISRKHAAVIRRNGTFYIKDLGSTNGIDYKGMRIDNKRIDEGDVFHLCDYELRFTYRTD